MLRGVLFVAVLGPVEVRRDGLGIRVPAGKPSELLVRLALDAGEPVRVDRLIEDLWGDQAVTVGRNTLQSKVSQLRRVLGDPALLTGDSAGYALALEPDQVDAHHVLRLAEAAGATRRSGDAEATLATCTEGLALFRGDELLPSGGSGGWLDPHRARLAEARLMLIEDQLAARSDLGGGAEIIGELERLVADHPLRESLWVLLITALYRSGRQADALAAYQRVQHTLAEELGLDPGPELQEVERKVLHHDQDLRPAPTSATPSVLAGNLPALSGSLVGRSADLGRVSTELAAARLVTVVGPAGVGKTRLAVEVARGIQVAGGCWLVRLEDAHDAASAWSAIAEALGLTAGTRPVVLDRLSAAEALLILDNCEHLAAPVAELALTLLGTAPGLRILATSQVALGLDGEVVHALAPLSLAESITLFATRAGQQRPGYDHDQRTGAAVEALCQSLDGLPLAIELAAARVKVLSVPEIARRIDDRFTLLSDPTGRRPARQRTLRAAIGWSYDLLFPDDQRGLWALSCFAGGAPLGAAEAVLAALGLPGTTVIDVLSRLIDRSLVLVDPASDGELRYRMLDSVRAFSLEQLVVSGEAESARRAHAAWYAEAAARTRARRTRLRAGRAPRPGRHRAGQHRPGTGLVRDGGPDARPRHRARVRLGVGGARRRNGRVPADARGPGRRGGSRPGVRPRGRPAPGRLAGGLQRRPRPGDRGHRAGDGSRAGARRGGTAALSFVRSQQGRAADALALLDRCRPAFAERGQAWEEAASWVLTAWAEIASGRLAEAPAACARALELLQPLGDNWGRIHAEAMLGELAQAQHRYAEATGHLGRAAEAAHALGFGAAESHHLTNLGRAQHQLGDHEAARATLARAIEIGTASADLRTVALARIRLGRVLRDLGETDAAREQVRAGRDWYAAAGSGEGQALAGFLLAALAADADEPAAEARLDQVLAAARRSGNLEIQVLALDALARWSAEHGRHDHARLALREADRLWPGVAHLVTEADRTDRVRALELLVQGRSR